MPTLTGCWKIVNPWIEHVLSISMSNECNEDTEKEFTFFFLALTQLCIWAITSWNRTFKKQFYMLKSVSVDVVSPFLTSISKHKSVWLSDCIKIFDLTFSLCRNKHIKRQIMPLNSDSSFRIQNKLGYYKWAELRSFLNYQKSNLYKNQNTPFDSAIPKETVKSLNETTIW